MADPVFNLSPMEKDFKQFEFSNKEFTKRLIQFREKQDWSVREVAKAVGISPASYSKIEFGRCVPNAQAFFNLCQLMNLDASKFFNHIKTKQNEKETSKFKLD